MNRFPQGCSFRQRQAAGRTLFDQRYRSAASPPNRRGSSRGPTKSHWSRPRSGLAGGWNQAEHSAARATRGWGLSAVGQCGGPTDTAGPSRTSERGASRSKPINIADPGNRGGMVSIHLRKFSLTLSRFSGAPASAAIGGDQGRGGGVSPAERLSGVVPAYESAASMSAPANTPGVSCQAHAASSTSRVIAAGGNALPAERQARRPGVGRRRGC